MLNRGVPRLCVRWSNSISYIMLYIEGKDGERHNATISKPNIHTTHIIQLSHLIIFNKPQYDRGLKIQHKSRADKSARRNDDSLCTRQMTWLVSVWPLNIISWFVINLILVFVCVAAAIQQHQQQQWDDGRQPMPVPAHLCVDSLCVLSIQTVLTCVVSFYFLFCCISWII